MKKSKSSVLASLQSIADGRTVRQEHWLNTAKPKELERNIQCSQAIKAATVSMIKSQPLKVPQAAFGIWG
jgi:hypothetical protein